MLCLIAFSLLILACSHVTDDSEMDLEEGEERESKATDGEKRTVDCEESILVIMAGDAKPTFLATPISSVSSSSGDNCSANSFCCNEKGEKLGEYGGILEDEEEEEVEQS